MRQLLTANNLYANSWDEQYCPPMMQDDSMPDESTSPTGENERLRNWLGNHDFQKFMGLEDKMDGGGTIMPDDYTCPADKLVRYERISRYGVLSSYAYNISDWNGGPAEQDIQCYWDSEDGGGVPQCTPQPWLIGHKRTAIPRASEKINFTEGNDWWASWENGANYVQGWDVLGQALSHSKDLPNYAEDVTMWGATLYRHNEGCNLAFYDGHVEYMSKEKIFIDEDGDLTDADDEDATGMWFVLE
jgi:prepilin-type processing-associated H-X9-DG protein